VTELHVHDWTPWHPLAVIEGVPWRRRICPGCASTQDEPTPAVRETPAGMESAIEAGAKALHHAEWTDGGFRELDAETCWAQDPDDHAGYYEQARILAAAAVPHIERAIRDRIAAELEAQADAQKPLGTHHAVGVFDGLLEASRLVARGGEATE